MMKRQRKINLITKDQTNLVELFEQNLNLLIEKFKDSINDYFFTEKELHSYFYHLSVNSGAFNHRGHYLVHTEYPSPFKCSYVRTTPYINQELSNSRTQRSHIDCVLINPTFIDWLFDHEIGLKPLIGIGNRRFDYYINYFYSIYSKFNDEVREAILLYAIEFKFLRHSYAGSKYPSLGIHQDIAKLRLLKGFNTGLGFNIDFVSRTKSVIFVGERTQAAGEIIKRELKEYGSEEYIVIMRKP